MKRWAAGCLAVLVAASILVGLNWTNLARLFGVSADPLAGELGSKRPRPWPPEEGIMGNRDGRARVERYPSVEAPESVAEGKPFSVLVSLTEEQLTPEVRIASGERLETGQLVLDLPADQAKWTLDVVLMAPGFELVDGENTATILLTREGDSTLAQFKLRAKPGGAPKRTLHVTFWYQKGFLAKVLRDLEVRPDPPASTPEPAQTAQETAKETAKETAPRTSSSSSTPFTDTRFRAPDLTVYATRDADGTQQLILSSPVLGFVQGQHTPSAELPAWLSSQYRRLATSRVRGVVEEDQPSAELTASARGLGKQLFREFAPQPFKDAYWRVREALGDRFTAIQIVTDDPTLPWELMVPHRTVNGREVEEDFLGVQHRLARWHLGRNVQLDRPPQSLPLEGVFVVAPEYGGAEQLPSQAEELAALQKLPGFSELPADMSGLAARLPTLPGGIVHFAGHGVIRKDAAGGATYAMRLHESELDVMAWRGLPSPKGRAPLYFFNACELGQAEVAAGTFIDGWAPAVLDRGGGGFIGALWPVDDASASTFARTFYERLQTSLDAHGEANVAELLQQTRAELSRSTRDATWLAYVYYGDPAFRFQRNATRRLRDFKTPDY